MDLRVDGKVTFSKYEDPEKARSSTVSRTDPDMQVKFRILLFRNADFDIFVTFHKIK